MSLGVSATATPTCAAASAGASLMPSPIMSRPLCLPARRDRAARASSSSSSSGRCSEESAASATAAAAARAPPAPPLPPPVACPLTAAPSAWCAPPNSETYRSLSSGRAPATHSSMPRSTATWRATLSRSPVSITTWSGGTPRPPACRADSADAEPGASASSKLITISTDGSSRSLPPGPPVAAEADAETGTPSRPHGEMLTNERALELEPFAAASAAAAASSATSAAAAGPPAGMPARTKLALPNRTYTSQPWVASDAARAPALLPPPLALPLSPSHAA
eukprot:9399-Chlamydomonas_euryale.AAC.1